MRKITETLRSARKIRGLSQTEIANHLGTKRQVVSNWERCETNYYSLVTPPNLKNLQKWADFLGFEIILKPKDNLQ